VTAQNSRPAEPAPASTASDDAPVIRTLLNEVSLLRQILAQTNLTGSRAQILGERIRIQQERIERLSRDLDSIRDQISEAKLQQVRTAELLKEVASQTKRESLLVTRNDLLH